MKFSALCARYLATLADDERKSLRSLRSRPKTLLAFFGDMQVDRISQDDPLSYRRMRRAEVGGTSVNREVEILRAMLNWHGVDPNPCHRIKPYRGKRRERFLTLEEVRRLIDMSPPHLRPIAEFALYTGMRKGKILGMRWRDVSFERGNILIPGSKSGRLRVVPMNGMISRVLIGLEPGGQEERVFPITDFKHSWATLVRKAGLEGLRFHDLRHTFASHFLMAGNRLEDLAEILGHLSVQTTKRYSHFAEDHKAEKMLRMDGYWQENETKEKGVVHFDFTKTHHPAG